MKEKLTKEQKRKYAEIIKKAWSNEEFKQQLLANPTKVFKEEGLELSESINIKILEDKADEQVLILPAVPKEDLTIEQIEERISAGSMFGHGPEDVWFF
jgi:hypothetical protein